MTAGGLLIGGRIVSVDGVTIHNPRDTAWSRLEPGDYAQRNTRWVRQVIPHLTKGIYPQHVKPGAGPGGKDKMVADFYRGDPLHNGAQIICDNDGTAACLVDLATAAAYQATTSNDWSIGIEGYQESDGGVYEAMLATMVRITLAVCDAFSIPRQMHGAPYRQGKIVERMKHGGPDCVGIIGHRDQSWVFPWQIKDARTRAKYPAGYAGRGRGDPGDIIMAELELAGVESFDYNRREDLVTWQRRRQVRLNQLGARLTVDGIAGLGTMEALRRFGFSSGRELDAALELPIC